ncbi:hypothetical protein IWQ60_011093 [Tieghemiomyces parasiticus]|uniref:Pyrroline-5-carboxylate reductase n=1 Tax=Tieghemiomyces parasiticus TaxID=78921 RepID=A0A9W7ZNR4_9FUNG|nr:hypothetical protein IWQ60_011093 [Tieghemiomyces parasiticus]
MPSTTLSSSTTAANMTNANPTTNNASGAPLISQSKILTFIGGGNMAEAILGGLIANGFHPSHLRVSDPMAERCAYMHNRYHVPVFTDNIAALTGRPGASPAGCPAATYPTDQRPTDVVILAVKPQVMHPVMADMGRVLLDTHPLIISIAAGIRVGDLLRWIKDGAPADGRTLTLPHVVRCMPNTPALVGHGASGLYAESSVLGEQKTIAGEIMGAVSRTFWVEREDMIDAVTGVSGSGPAYFFLMLEAMQQGGVEAGLSPKLAAQLAAQTCLGAAHMILNSDESAAELRRKVTSPKGTTEAAVNTMIEGGLKEAVISGVLAADRRSKDLADQLGQQ